MTEDTIDTLREHRKLADRVATLRAEWKAAKIAAKVAKGRFEAAMNMLAEVCCSWELSDDLADRPLLAAAERASEPLATAAEVDAHFAGLDAEANGDGGDDDGLTEELMEAARILMPDDDGEDTLEAAPGPLVAEGLVIRDVTLSGGDLGTTGPGSWLTGDPGFVEATEAEFRRQDEAKRAVGALVVTSRSATWHDDEAKEEKPKRRRKAKGGATS